MALPTSDLLSLFRAILDIESVSHNEARLADEVEAALRRCPHLEVIRDGNSVVARTNCGRAERVIIAGHLDTVPIAHNFPSTIQTEDGQAVVYGRGSADMKGGIAVMVWLAAEMIAPVRDITWVFYDCEEIAADYNGLKRLVDHRPELLSDAAIAVLMEPTSAQVEGGCQGTMRFEITTTGVAAHSARSWLGNNAIHQMAQVINRVMAFEAREIEVEGLVYREGLNATMIRGGVAGNVIPDEAVIQINYRFAPDKTVHQALALMKDWFGGRELTILDLSPSARPGLDRPAAVDFVRAVGGVPRPKYGWTDVARFSALGIPAVNYGPADAGKAHAIDECCPLSDLEICLAGLRRWLSEEGEAR